MYYIYELVDPITNQVRYVGITNNPDSRLKSHLSIHETNPAKSEWIKNLLSQNLSVEMNIIDTVEDIKSARKLEKNLINAHSLNGIQILNVQHVISPIKKPIQKDPINSHKDHMIKRRTASDAYKWADYENELVCDPNYLDDAFADYIDEMQEMDKRIFNEEDVRTELDLHTLGRFTTPKMDWEEEAIGAWYLNHFRKGGRFEGDTPTIKFESRLLDS